MTSWGNQGLDRLAAVTSYGLTISHDVRWIPGDGTWRTVTVIRLSTLAADQLDAATSVLRRTCRDAGVGLQPLRGRQASGLRSTVPGGRR